MIYSVDALEAKGWEKIIDTQNGKAYKLHAMHISIWYDFMTGRCVMGGRFGKENCHLSYGTDTLEAVVEVMRDMEKECKTNEQI